MEIATEAGALVRNDNVVRCPAFLYKFHFSCLPRKADLNIHLFRILYI